MPALGQMRTNVGGVLLVSALLGITGCHRMDVGSVTSKLRLGMSKAELDSAFKDMTFLREQRVAVYPNRTVEEMRGKIGPDNPMEWWYPKTLAGQFRFDGNEKVYSYLIQKKYVFANGWFFDYLAVFYDPKTDKVIGWGFFHELGKPETWDERF